MTKTPKTKSETSANRGKTRNNTNKVKVGLYLTPDMVDFIDKKIAVGDAYNYTSFVYCCVKKYILAEIKNKQEV